MGGRHFQLVEPKYKWNQLQWLEYEINDGLNVLRIAISSNEDIIENRKKRYQEALKKDQTLQSLEEEYKASYIGQVYGSFEITQYELKYVLRNASLTAIFSFFENMIRQVCEETHRKLSSSLHFNDLNSRKAFDRYTNYLRKVALVNISSSQVIMSKIRLYQLVRNKVVHTDGKGRLSFDEYKKFKDLDGLRFIPNSTFEEYPSIMKVESSSFLMNLVQLIKEYFEKLLKEIDNRVTEN